MKRLKTIKYLFGSLLLVVAMMSVGCGNLTKVLNSGDPEQVYDLALGMYEQEDWNKAANLFDALSTSFSGTSRDDSLQFYRARSRFKNGEYEVAGPLFDEFRRKYSRSVFLDDAEGMYTLCYYYMAPKSTRDSAMIGMAIVVIDEFLARHPFSAQYDVFLEMREDLIGRLHEKSFMNAYTYYKTGYYKSAIIAFRNALKDYPESIHREKISYYIVASAFKLADNSVSDKKEDRFLSMIDAYYTFIAGYPNSTYRDEVDRMLKRANSYIDSTKSVKSTSDEDIAADQQ